MDERVTVVVLLQVHFTNFDPFGLFSAPKLQSFVMNNCVGPSRVLRYVRIFAALSRASQLSRLELVGCRFFENLTDNSYYTPRCFRSLQRLVLAGNRDVREIDLGILLIAAQQSLSHFALQTYHTKNSLFEALLCAGVSMNKLESLVLGYQDPYQSRLTVQELSQAELVDSADNIMPLCSITDRGLENCLRLCPRLGCLTVRHAPFLEDMSQWRSLAPRVQPNSSEDPSDEGEMEQNATEDETSSPKPRATNRPGPGTHSQHSHSMPFHGDLFASTCHGASVRSLTLENCPGLGTATLEDAIFFGDPFPCLETLVLRNMFLGQPGSENSRLDIRSSWEQRWGPRIHSLSPQVRTFYLEELVATII
ncbi:F-box only protein 38 [Cichlidogyrus casuarinus]|uniref:F-box only protein 38 n=1 Tax=Cichlidogyrus casuarinus TaxID=1844966 RepID=A0ABD2QJJ7_9PLAT